MYTACEANDQSYLSSFCISNSRLKRSSGPPAAAADPPSAAADLPTAALHEWPALEFADLTLGLGIFPVDALELSLIHLELLVDLIVFLTKLELEVPDLSESHLLRTSLHFASS